MLGYGLDPAGSGQGKSLFTQYCAGDQTEKNKMGGACSTYEGEEMRVKGYGWET